MAPLTFSQFANFLFPFCGNGEDEAKFVETLTNKIMQGKPGAKDYDNKSRNPILNKNTRTKQYYFTGERNISAKNAQVILGSADKYKFEQYLKTQYSVDSLLQLKKVMIKYLPEETDKEIDKETKKKDVASFCEYLADLFVDILTDLAAGKMDGRRKNIL